ncbi:hypothetical protein P154DRAFT_581026 [Amniculicola lignicola CBS 123094]|uniref:Uncharacterized protein n=1 Tax=Amniculicola lignicola CBS 123094 TaxID=1392246 RepID=A0A6A5W845_9PLEO|nr:hypothetical protein P154DRAFT_581026 [Amniculicola lignicola CBS 123094]
MVVRGTTVKPTSMNTPLTSSNPWLVARSTLFRLVGVSPRPSPRELSQPTNSRGIVEQQHHDQIKPIEIGYEGGMMSIHKNLPLFLEAARSLAWLLTLQKQRTPAPWPMEIPGNIWPPPSCHHAPGRNHGSKSPTRIRGGHRCCLKRSLTLEYVIIGTSISGEPLSHTTGNGPTHNLVQRDERFPGFLPWLTGLNSHAVEKRRPCLRARV